DDARIAALETTVAELREELERMRRTPHRSMRETYRCSRCGGTKVLHFAHVKDLAHNGMVDLALQKDFSAFWGMKSSGGALEAFACRSCRIVEWHAISLDDVQPDGTDVIELDGSEGERPMDPTPYR
ncbi:MAG: hypothetical protein ABI175_28425, partial [Polyangiales bacterium]